MKKREYSCEELSEILDRACSEDGLIRKLHPEMCEGSYRDFVQLQKTVHLLNSLKDLKINDRFFSTRVLACCEHKRRHVARLIQHFVLPSVAAASFLLVISFGIYNGNIRFPRQETAVAQKQYEIKLDQGYTSAAIKDMVADNNGLVVKIEDGVIHVRSALSDYHRIKQQLLLTEEERAFSSQTEGLMLTGTAPVRQFQPDYADQIINFVIIPSEGE